MSEEKEAARGRREDAAKRIAAERKQSFTYIDDDGCEINVTPTGHVFFNAADWY